jgi:uncharacterized protein (TIGR02246 family)
MEHWELVARESIRDLVARYNANGDSGRFDQMVELFAPDAVMLIGDTAFKGREQIRTIFTSAADSLRERPGPVMLRHLTSTLQIDVQGPDAATSRCYYHVLMPHGLDHWGRYLDEYRVVEGQWRFALRREILDGAVPGGWAASRAGPS